MRRVRNAQMVGRTVQTSDLDFKTVGELKDAHFHRQNQLQYTRAEMTHQELHHLAMTDIGRTNESFVEGIKKKAQNQGRVLTPQKNIFGKVKGYYIEGGVEIQIVPQDPHVSLLPELAVYGAQPYIPSPSQQNKSSISQAFDLAFGGNRS